MQLPVDPAAHQKALQRQRETALDALAIKEGQIEFLLQRVETLERELKEARAAGVARRAEPPAPAPRIDLLKG